MRLLSPKLNILQVLLIFLCSMISSVQAMAVSTEDGREIAKSIRGLSFVKSYGGIDEFKLGNGLKVLLKPDLSASLISWQVWYKVGSRNEVAGLTGLAHYLEHMMFKGTKLFRKGEIAQIIQLKGGVFNAFTGDDYTAYFENFAPEHLGLAIKIESERMRRAQLNEDELNLERSVIVSELEGGENNPQNLLYKNLKATAFQVHPYKNPVIGWSADLANINHKNMKDFYDTYYHPNNSVIVLAGNFDKKVALKMISKDFGKLKRINKQKHIIGLEPEQKAYRRAVLRNPGLVTLLGMAFHVPEFNHEDSPALHVLADIAFGGVSSRLYKKLIDSGLAVDVSGTVEASIDPSIFRIMATINPDEKIEEVEKIIDTELERLKEDVSDDEILRSKARVEAAAIYERDGVYEEGLQIGYFEAITGDWTRYVDWVGKINKVESDDVKNVAKKYFKEYNKTAVYLLPESPRESLIFEDESPEEIAGILIDPGHKIARAYGAATVEPLDQKKLKRLLKIAESKSSKDLKKHKLNLNVHSSRVAPGVKLVYKEDHHLPLVYIDAVLYSGSINDIEEKKLGLAYFTAEMLERGTQKRDKFEISRLLDLYGAEINFDAKKETLDISVSSLSKNLDKTLSLLKEILYEPRFDKEELDKLKVESIAAIKHEDDNLGKITAKELNRLIYPETHPYYSYTPEEKIKAVESINIEDIRNYYKNYYNANNLIVSVVGDISKADTDSKVMKIFDNWNNGKDSKKNTPPKIDIIKANDAKEIIVTKKSKQQVEIRMGHSGDVDRLHPDFYALLIANHALGGSALSSRLGTVVRDEHGLVYNVRSSFNASLGAGSFTISLGCNPANVDKAVKLTKEVVSKFLQEGISRTELEATKSYLVGSFAARNIASNRDLAMTLAYMEVFHLDKDYIENYAQYINSLTVEDVNKAARRYIHPDKFHVVIAGPYPSEV